MKNFKIGLLFASRILSPLTMFWNPFIGFIIANFFDAFDVVFMSMMGLDKYFEGHKYQLFDKLFDNFWLICCFVSAFVLPIVPKEYMPFFIFLFVIRMIGSALMLYTHKRIILLITPNFFMYYYLVFSFLFFINDYSFLNSQWFAIVIAGFFIFNYCQEIVLHFLQIHPWMLTKKLLAKKR